MTGFRLLSQPLFAGVFAACCSILAAFSFSALEGVSQRADAPPPSVSAQRGRRYFVQSCSHCHGDDARGSGEDGDGPSLFRLPMSDKRIASVIRRGIPDEMPSFSKKHGVADIADIVGYLRTLK